STVISTKVVISSRLGVRARLIPSPTTHLRSSSGRTSTRRTRSSPSIGSVFSPPVLLHRSIRDRPASSSLILHPIQSLPLDFPRTPHCSSGPEYSPCKIVIDHLHSYVHL
ncbi:hypothetical protein CROQUDRAFT_662152, partial [Cronartium quercuum f. sp. fusiforme G11]